MIANTAIVLRRAGAADAPLFTPIHPFIVLSALLTFF
jgi:hypothetical protein